VLRVVRSKLEDSDAFVPHIAVAVAIILALISVGFLIHFIHHAARSIQASVILGRVTDEALEHVERLFPNEIGKPASVARAEPEIPPTKPRPICADGSGYLQAVDGKSLFDLGKKHQILIRMAMPVGAFVVEGQAVADVWADAQCDDELCDAIRSAFLLGDERTPDQDVEFSILEIADMGVKALSPGINDPTTATHCIDRLTQILLALGRRGPPEALRTEEGRVHFLAMPSTFADACDVAFGQLFHFGRDNPAIVSRLLAAVGTLRRLLPPERHAELSETEEKLRK
jgi:uncharacterized membrane protein